MSESVSGAAVRELEIKITYWEHHVAQQDRAMLDLARRLDRLERRLQRLEAAAKSGESDAGAGADAERPPHY